MTKGMEAIMAKMDEIRDITLIGVKEVLTMDECSLVTGYSKSALYQFTYANEIPHFKRGKRVFFSKKQVEKWLQENYVPTNKEINDRATTYTVLNERR